MRRAKDSREIDRFRDLLSEKYDIPVSKYFTLKEEEKEEIVDIVLQYYKSNLDVDPRLIHLYIGILDDQLRKAREDEEYERCDIITRTHEYNTDKQSRSNIQHDQDDAYDDPNQSWCRF